MRLSSQHCDIQWIRCFRFNQLHSWRACFFFKKKIDDIRAATTGTQPSTFYCCIGQLHCWQRSHHSLLFRTFVTKIKCVKVRWEALHCCKAHSDINRKMENSTPCKIVTPENFIWSLTHVITSTRSPTTQFWCRSLQWELLPKYVKYSPFVTFSCPVLSCTVLFYIFTRPTRTARPIFMFYGSNDVVPPKDGPFGVRTMTDIFWWKSAPKTRQKGTWIEVFKPKTQNTKTCLLSKLLHRFQPNFAQW